MRQKWIGAEIILLPAYDIWPTTIATASIKADEDDRIDTYEKFYSLKNVASSNAVTLNKTA